MNQKKTVRLNSEPFKRTPTGIAALDDIMLGGLPLHRPTLICGSTGRAKTLFALDFLINGIRKYGEPGVLMSFEATRAARPPHLMSSHFSLKKLEAQKKLVVEHIVVDRSKIEETGGYDLGGLIVRLEYAIDSVGAKRVVLDTIEVLFAGFNNRGILRAEMRRLFRWLKDKGITVVVTGERGGSLVDHNFDCVIVLDKSMSEQLSARREYTILVDKGVISVTPLGLTRAGPHQRTRAGKREAEPPSKMTKKESLRNPRNRQTE